MAQLTIEQQLITARAKTREQIAAGAATMHRLSADGRWSEATRSDMLATAKTEMTNGVAATISDAAGAVGREQARAEKALAALQPSDAAKAVAAASLKPVLDAAASDPSVLFRAYRRTFTDPASRAVLEGLAATLGADVFQGGKQLSFQEQWQRTHQQMAPQQSPEEQAARADIARAQQAEAYLHDLATVVTREIKTAGQTHDLASLAAGERHLGGMLAATNAAFRMQQFEQSVPDVEPVPDNPMQPIIDDWEAWKAAGH